MVQLKYDYTFCYLISMLLSSSIIANTRNPLQDPYKKSRLDDCFGQ